MTRARWVTVATVLVGAACGKDRARATTDAAPAPPSSAASGRISPLSIVADVDSPLADSSGGAGPIDPPLVADDEVRVPAGDEPSDTEVVAEGSGASGDAVTNVTMRLKTVAGVLRIVDKGAARGDDFVACQFAALLDARVLLATDCRDPKDPLRSEPVIGVLQVVKTPVAPFDEVIVFQQSAVSNACNGGPVWLVGLRRDGTFERSALIDFCGGKDPVVQVKGDAIAITLSGGRPKHGSRPLPTEKWVFQGGELKKQSP